MEGFECVRALGTGGFAATYLFSDLRGEYGGQVAIKIPHDKEREEALVCGDIRSLSALHDVPYIVKILDVKRAEDRYILLMEYVDGPSLRHLLGPLNEGKPLSISKAVSYALHVAQGLASAHDKGFVHRDIKPENIIVDQKEDVAKILDFGIASLVKDEGYFMTSDSRHTPYYTPREVVFEKKGDVRVDVYSLGMTLYEMLTGKLPFFEEGVSPLVLFEYLKEMREPESPRKLNPQVPCYLEDAVLKAVAPDKNARFHDMKALIQSLLPPREIKMAEDHMAAGNAQRAEIILRSLAKKRPSDTRCHAALASLLNRCHRASEARDLLVKAIELDPDDPEIRVRACVTLLQLGEKEEAQRHLRHAESLCCETRLKRQILALRHRVVGRRK